MLLEHKADVNKRDMAKESAMYWAVQEMSHSDWRACLDLLDAPETEAACTASALTAEIFAARSCHPSS